MLNEENDLTVMVKNQNGGNYEQNLQTIQIRSIRKSF